jgi:hypothetical protein
MQLEYGKKDCKFLTQHEYTTTKCQTINLRTHPYGRELTLALNCNNECTAVNSCSSIIVQGTKYCLNDIVLLANTDDCLPKFGRVREIYVEKRKVVFYCNALETSVFVESLNAYQISDTEVNTLYSIDVLQAKQTFPEFILDRNSYTVMTSHCCVEFSG